MLIGYARVSKNDGSQKLRSQIDQLKNAGVKSENIFYDRVSGVKSKREGLNNCLKMLREGDILVVYKLDRLGRSLKHLIELIDSLRQRQIGFKVIANGEMDTTTPHGRLIFQIIGVMAEFERELIRERTRAGLEAARARGRLGGRPSKLTKNHVRGIVVAMKDRNTNITELCNELSITKQTLFNYVSPKGELRERGKKLLGITS